MDNSTKSEEEFVDSSSDSILVDDWQDLSNYAKVIFCDRYHHPDTGIVGCKFQITDNVHEDPCDYVGLFRVGYDDLSQCLVSKLLSGTVCEDDGKLLRCVFTYEELPDLEDGYYQFFYVTRDKEICGASMPLEIKLPYPKDEPSTDDIVAEKGEDDFLMVKQGFEKRKNQLLGALLEKYRSRNKTQSTLIEEKEKMNKEKEDIIANLHQEILHLKGQDSENQSTINKMDTTLHNISEQMEFSNQAQMLLENEKIELNREITQLKKVIKEKEKSLPFYEQEKCILVEQLDDQKFMIRALEDSKQLAMKEMKELSESLAKNKKALTQTRSELVSCKAKLQEANDMHIKRTDDLLERQNRFATTIDKLESVIKLLERKIQD